MKIGIFAMLSERTLYSPVSVACRCEEFGFKSIWVLGKNMLRRAGSD
jgi:hypothetical protein